MPYIKKSERDISRLVDDLKQGFMLKPGELNFLITTLIDRHITIMGKNYDILNEVIGVLECAKLELYRRVIAPYEDKKIKENGDVYLNAKH